MDAEKMTITLDTEDMRTVLASVGFVVCDWKEKARDEKAAARCASVVPAFSAAVVAPVQGCFCCLPKGSDSSLNGISLQW